MDVPSRLAHLVGHFWTGPLLGLRNRILVPDRRPPEHETWTMILWPAMVLAAISSGQISGPIRFAFLLLLLPVAIYAFSSIEQIVLEYRAYLATAGIAILAALSGPYIAIPLALFFILQTRRRLYFFQHPIAFWKEAHRHAPDPGILSNYLYVLAQFGQFAEARRLASDLVEFELPNCRTLLINIAACLSGIYNDTADPASLQSARALLEETVIRWPDHADGWRNLGAIRALQNDPGAIKSFERAIAVDRTDALSHLGAGEWYLTHGDLDMAVVRLGQAACLAPQVDHIRFQWLVALHRAGEWGILEREQLKDPSMVVVTESMLPEDIRRRMDDA